VIWQTLSPNHFLAKPDISFSFDSQVLEEVPWELFRGHLLGPRHTRASKRFESWNVFLGKNENIPEQPLISVKLDVVAQELHVVRSLRCAVWEGYEASPNTFLSRELIKWVPELSATLDLTKFHNDRELLDELTCQLFHAFVGKSRLPLTSVESPLPQFSLGQATYVYQASHETVPHSCSISHSAIGLLDAQTWQLMSHIEQIKLLELVLRSTPASDLKRLAASFEKLARQRRWQSSAVIELFRDVFNETSLTPYTDFIPKTLSFVNELSARGCLSEVEVIDFWAGLTCRVVRHLTAYDLIQFHHRGANYPDVLLLDALLKLQLEAAASRPERYASSDVDDPYLSATKRRRRRSLRLGILVRQFYEGLPVPSVPVSPGENKRILPAPHQRVPEEQILNPQTRTKRLFDNDPITPFVERMDKNIRNQLASDLTTPRELIELGMALFLDRPFAGLVGSPERDPTPILSYWAFSKGISAERLDSIGRKGAVLFGDDAIAAAKSTLQHLHCEGLRINDFILIRSKTSFSLADAALVADDFLLLRTTPGSAQDFFNLFDFSSALQAVGCQDLLSGGPVLIVRTDASSSGEPLISIFDIALKRRIELKANCSQGFENRAGISYPCAGLTLWAAWDKAGNPATIPLAQATISPMRN
jgi:hypothetical protein